MLVFSDGTQRGTLGGGRMEAEVKGRALALLESGRAEFMTISLDGEKGGGEKGDGDGPVGGGGMRILIEPVRQGASCSYFECLLDRLESGRGCTEVVILEALGEAPTGARFLLDDAGRTIAQTGTESIPDAALRGLRSLNERPRAYVVDQVSYLPTLLRHRLIIVGAGEVGQLTARLAAEVDFDVWIVDDRDDFCSAERFPGAGGRIVGPISETLSRLETTPEDFSIVVTRNRGQDEDALFHLVRKSFCYLGMIGNRRKVQSVFENLESRGVDPKLLASVHAPVGFDIGSQTAAEIAVSIVAELIACRNRVSDRSAGFVLRDPQPRAGRNPSGRNETLTTPGEC